MIQIDLVEGLDWSFDLKDENGFIIHEFTYKNEDFTIQGLNTETYSLHISNKCGQEQLV